MRLKLGITNFEEVPLIKGYLFLPGLNSHFNHIRRHRRARRRTIKISPYLRRNIFCSSRLETLQRKEVKILDSCIFACLETDPFLSCRKTGEDHEQTRCPNPPREVVTENKLMMEQNEKPMGMHPARQIVRAVKTAKIHESSNALTMSRLAKFGVHISALRRKEKLSTQEFAERADLPENLIVQIELGLATLDQVIENLERISIALRKDSKEISNLLTITILEGCGNLSTEFSPGSRSEP